MFYNFIHMINNLFVCKAEDFNAVLADYHIPEFIVILLFLVNTAVYFDHNFELVAIKIGNKTVDDLLPSKTVAF